jgi:glycosyltransferase involved in cell wall biosynthesis
MPDLPPENRAATEPWFAVTMTVRNNARTIGASLGTILPQLADGGELVIVDALSDDGTQELLQGVARSHPEVTVIERACNRGVGRNLAVATARAPIVLTQVDGDNQYADGVLRQVATRLRDTPGWDAAFAVGAADWDPSSTRFYAWRRAGFVRSAGYEERQEREDPPLLLRAFRAGLRIERCLLPKLADDLKPRKAGRAPSVGPWGRGRHTMWAARKFRVMGYRYPEYVRLLRLTRRTEARYFAGAALGGAAFLQGALARDGPDVLERDDEPRAGGPAATPPANGTPGAR